MLKLKIKCIVLRFDYTVFNNKTPHKLGDYTVKYYTSHNQGGTATSSVVSASGTCGIDVNWKIDAETRTM